MSEETEVAPVVETPPVESTTTFDTSDDPVEEAVAAPEGEAVPAEPAQAEDGEAPPVEPDVAPAAPKVEFNDQQQEVFNREIAKKVAAQKEAERNSEALQAQLAEANLKLNPPATRPDVPPVPDSYDSLYQQKIQERDAAIQKAAAFDARQSIVSEVQLYQQRQTQQAQQKAAEEAIGSYVDRGEKLGHDKGALVSATEHLMNLGLSVDAQSLIRDDAAGPDIAMYLSRHPEEMTKVLELQSGNGVMAIAHIASEIKSKASGSFRQTKMPPDPVDHLSGRGAAEGSVGPKGATYT